MDRSLPRTDRRLLAALAVLAAGAVAFAAAPAHADVVSSQLDCVTVDPDAATVTGTWGYTNTTDHAITLLPGSDNFFKPSPSFQGQPVVFQPGTFNSVFQSTFDLNFDATSTWVVLGTQQTASLDWYSCFTPNGDPVKRADPAIVGTPLTGSRLALDPGLFAGDVDRIDVQWQRDNPVGSDTWDDIAGANGPGYIPTGDDVGHRLRATVSARSIGYVVARSRDGLKIPADGGGSTTAITDATDAVTAPAAAPTAGTPTISGTPFVGQTLTASPGTWTGVSSFAYDWQRCDSACTSTGQTGTTYVLGAADAGKRLRVVVTPSGADQPAAASAETDVVGQPAAPAVLTASPSSLNFGSQKLGRTVLRTVIVKNTSSSAVVVGGLTRSGTAAAEFTPISTCLLQGTLGPRASCAVAVAFSTRVLGSRTAELKILQADGTAVTVALSGTGVR
jgi:hypothetical protein